MGMLISVGHVLKSARYITKFIIQSSEIPMDPSKTLNYEDRLYAYLQEAKSHLGSLDWQDLIDKLNLPTSLNC